MSADRDELLREYVMKLAPDGNVEALLRRDAEGLEATGGPDDDSVLVKLARGEPLSRLEQFHLEAIIIPDKRPAIDIQGGDYFTNHALWRHWNAPEVKAVLRPCFASIGRIELPGHPFLPYGGTGFVVGSQLLMTNRHVAELFASGLGLRSLNFLPGRRAAVDFLQERTRPAGVVLDVRRIVMVHPFWDMALLEVEGLAPDHPTLSLTLKTPEDLDGREVALVGYPAFDPRNPADVQNQVFGGVYEVKRLMPGMVGPRRMVSSFGHSVNALTYDASTLGGVSGSAALDRLTGEVLALHFSGVYLDANFGVPAYELSRDCRVVDAGVQFAGVPDKAFCPWEAAWADNETTSSASIVGGVATPTTSQSPATPATGSGTSPYVVEADGSVTLSVPLQINLRLGTALSAAAVSPSAIGAAASTEAMVEPIHNTDYRNRRGYDAGFLGIEVSAPKPSAPGGLALLASGESELRYTHFSVWVQKKRKLALMTASNLDASPARKRPGNRPESDYNRDGLGGLRENDTEKWFQDKRLLATEQLADKFFNRDRKAFDKGHIVRRDDVAWGDTYEEMQEANGDTFHIPNCSPQVKGFNRSNTPGERTNWGNLENLVLKQAAAEKLSLFAGPVLDDADKTFVGVDDAGPVEVQIPSRYWKVIVARKEAKLQAFAFILKQNLADAGLEFTVPDIWVPFMIRLNELEPLAGVKFAQSLHDADQYGAAAGESVANAAGLASITNDAPTRPVPAPQAISNEAAEVFALWRAQQGEDKERGARFVLNFGATGRPEDAAIAAAITRDTGLRVNVGALFDPDPDLDRHRLVAIPSVARLDRSDMFEIARSFRDISGAETVDPDLGTDYYDWPEANAEDGNVESAAFWCWTDESKKPGDADWAIKAIKVPEAWAFSEAAGQASRGRDIRIFQPDTGVALHPEMPDGTATNLGYLNLIERDRPATDPMTGGLNPGHGTGTASVAASPESQRMRGSAPAATLVPIRCIESVAVFDQSPVAQAIDHARRNGADIITMSLGGIFSSALHAAVRKAVQANIIVMAAAGNCVGAVVWPARYAEAIAVGGINSAFQPWQGSSRGSDVDISGPAEFVLNADPRVHGNPAALTAGQGTSYATALLAGVAALWLAHHGRQTLVGMLPAGTTLQEMFRSSLAVSAQVPEGFDTNNFGAGIFDAEALIQRQPSALLGVESVFATPTTDIRRQVAQLVAEATGPGGLEAASPALNDLQNAPELACVALDQMRRRRRTSATLEALPPQGLSPALRRAIGARSSDLTGAGGVNG